MLGMVKMTTRTNEFRPMGYFHIHKTTNNYLTSHVFLCIRYSEYSVIPTNFPSHKPLARH